MSRNVAWRHRYGGITEPVAGMGLGKLNYESTSRIISQFNGEIEGMTKCTLHVRRALPNAPAVRDTIDGNGTGAFARNGHWFDRTTGRFAVATTTTSEHACIISMGRRWCGAGRGNPPGYSICAASLRPPKYLVV